MCINAIKTGEDNLSREAGQSFLLIYFTMWLHLVTEHTEDLPELGKGMLAPEQGSGISLGQHLDMMIHCIMCSSQTAHSLLRRQGQC